MTNINQPTLDNKEDVKAFLLNLSKIMQSLRICLNEESQLIQQGKFAAIGNLTEKKSELISQYALTIELVQREKKQISRFAPVELRELQELHEELAQDITSNMEGLFIAHQSSQNLIQDIAQIVERKRTPTTYGQSGTIQQRSKMANGITANYNL